MFIPFSKINKLQKKLFGLQFMLPIEKSVTFTDTCANEITFLYSEWIIRSSANKAKEGGHVRMLYSLYLP